MPANTNSILFHLRSAIASNKVTICTGPASCGKTSTLAYLERQMHGGSSSSSDKQQQPQQQHAVNISLGGQSSSGPAQLHAILHLSGTTLDSTVPTKVVRRLMVELARPELLLSAEAADQVRSAAVSAPDEHLTEAMLTALETYVRVQQKSNTALVFFIDGLESMFDSSGSVIDDIRETDPAVAIRGHNRRAEDHHAGAAAATSANIAESPLMRLLDMLPVQAESFFPKIRWVFSFRSESPSEQQQQQQQSNNNNNHADLIAAFLERLTGHDCVNVDFEESIIAGFGGVAAHQHKSASASASASSASSKVALVAFPQCLRRASAEKIITSQLSALGKSWPSSLMAIAVASTPSESETELRVDPETVDLPPRSAQSLAAVRSIIRRGEAPRCGSPGFVSLLIKELSASAVFETLEPTLTARVRDCASVADLLAATIRRLCETHGAAPVLAIIAALCFNKIGVTELEIADIAAGANPRTVAVVLSALRDMIIDRAGALRAGTRLASAWKTVVAGMPSSSSSSSSAMSATAIATSIERTVRQNFVQQLLSWLEREKEATGRVCRELPSQYLALGEHRKLAAFLARPDIMLEMFVAAKKEEYLALWRCVMARDSSVRLDSPALFNLADRATWNIDGVKPTDTSTVAAIILLSRLYGAFGKSDAAIAMLERANASVAKCDSSEREATTDATAAAVIDSTKAQLLQRLAQAQVSAGNFADGVATVQRALKLAAPEQIAGLLKVLGRGFRRLGDFEQALDCFDRALKAIEQQHRHEQSALSASSMKMPSNTNATATAAALAAAPTKILHAAGSLRTESTSLFFQRMDHDVAACLDEKGDALRKLGRHSEALQVLRQSLAHKQQTLSARHPAIALTNFSIAAVEKAQGAAQKAFVTVSEAIRVFEGVYGSEHPRLFEMKSLQASAAETLGHLQVARALYLALFEWCRDTFGDDKIETAETLQALAHVFKKMGAMARAQALLPEAHRVLAKHLPSDHHKLAKILRERADLERKVGKLGDSVLHAQQALAMAQRLFGEHHVTTAECRLSLGLVMMKRSSENFEFEACIDMFHKALAVVTDLLGSDHATTAQCECALGDAQRKTTNNLLKAIDTYQHALRTFESNFGPNHIETVDVVYKIGRCQKKMHWYKRAERTFEAAIEAMKTGVAERRSSTSLMGGGAGGGGSSAALLQQQAAAAAATAAKKRRRHDHHAHRLLATNDFSAALQDVERDAAGAASSTKNGEEQDDDDDDVMLHPKMAILQQSLGDCLRKQLETERARALYEAALNTNRKLYGDVHEEICEDLNGLAMCLFLGGDLDAALPLAEQTLAMTIECLGPANRHTKNRTRNLNLVLAALGKPVLPGGTASASAEAPPSEHPAGMAELTEENSLVMQISAAAMPAVAPAAPASPDEMEQLD